MKAGFCRKEPLSREKPMNRLLSARYMRSPAYTAPSSSTWEKPVQLQHSGGHRGKEVHWYLMVSSGYYSRPQREEYFVDSGYYKYHEAYHLLKFSNERQILEKAYQEYLELKRANLWKVQPQAQGKYGKLV